MKRKKIYRDRLLKVLLTTEEYETFQTNYSKTIFRLPSDYHRALLFGKPVKLQYRNRSLDQYLEIAGQIKGSIDAIERSWARAVKDLRDRPPTADITSALAALLAKETDLLQILKDIRETLLKKYDDESQDSHVHRDELPDQLQ